MKRTVEAWNKYWFSVRPLHGLALFRFSVGLLLFLYYLKRFQYAEVMYSTESFFYFLPFVEKLSVPIFSPQIVEGILLICIVSSLFFAVGFLTRFFNLILVILVAFLGSLEGMYSAACFNLLLISAILLLFSPAGRFGSLDYLIWLRSGRKKGEEETQKRKLGPIWVQRLIVVQFAVAYLSSAFYKSIYAYGWYTGEFLKFTFLDSSFGQRPLGLWFVDHPWMLPVAGTLSLLLEFFMVIFLLTPQFAILAIFLGIVFHGLILFTFNLTWIFSFTMFALFILVLPPEYWQRFFESHPISLEKLTLNRLKLKKV